MSSVPRRTDETEQIHREQILAIVKEGEAGRRVADLSRTHGITEQTYYRWKAKYGGMELSEMQRLKQLEDENRRLKQIVAEQTLDIPGAQGGRRKKVVAPIARREAVGWLQTRGTSLRRACRVVGLSTATWRYQPRRMPRMSPSWRDCRRMPRSGRASGIGGCISSSSGRDSW